MTVTIPIAGAVHVEVEDGLTKEQALEAAYAIIDAADKVEDVANIEWDYYETMGRGNVGYFRYNEVEIN